MTKVKICGLITDKHVNVAVDSGADYLGFVFAKSKRQISPKKVLEMTKNLPEHVKKVGVFVSPSMEELELTIEAAQLDLIQLHGKQQKEVLETLKTSYFSNQGIEVIQAFNGEQVDLIEVINQSSADYILLDAPSDTEMYAGGNGKSFKWEETAKKLEAVNHRTIFIAGGLTSQNVKKACEIFQPYGIDVSSGVETEGKKNSKKIQQFIQVVKEEDHV